MTIGPGKYDHEAMIAFELTEATGVILIILGGNKGNGFSTIFADPTLLKNVPELLRTIADQIDKDMSQIENMTNKGAH